MFELKKGEKKTCVRKKQSDEIILLTFLCPNYLHSDKQPDSYNGSCYWSWPNSKLAKTSGKKTTNV